MSSNLCCPDIRRLAIIEGRRRLKNGSCRLKRQPATKSLSLLEHFKSAECRRIILPIAIHQYDDFPLRIGQPAASAAGWAKGSAGVAPL